MGEKKKKFTDQSKKKKNGTKGCVCYKKKKEGIYLRLLSGRRRLKWDDRRKMSQWDLEGE